MTIFLLIGSIWVLGLMLVVGLCAAARTGDSAQEQEAKILASRMSLAETESVRAAPAELYGSSKRERTSIAA